MHLYLFHGSTEEVKQSVGKAVRDVVDPIKSKVSVCIAHSYTQDV